VGASKQRFKLSSDASHEMTNSNDRYLQVDKATFVCLAVVFIAHTLNGRTAGLTFFFRHWYPLPFFILLCDRVTEREDNRAKQEITQKEFSLDFIRSD
jgi:hypothetical protein